MHDLYRHMGWRTVAGQGPQEPTERPAPSAPTYRTCVVRPTAGRLTSGYGERRSRQDPDTEVMHGGADYAGAMGAPVFAAADGIVEHATENGARGFARYGRVIVLKHPQFTRGGETLRTLYAHLNPWTGPGSWTVTPGTVVMAGEQIGQVGNTDGSTTNPGSTFSATAEREGRESGSNAHLHFEVAKGGYPRPPVSRTDDPRSVRIDPEAWLSAHPACDPDSQVAEDTPQRRPSRVSSRERSRLGGVPLWGVFALFGLVAVALKGRG